jgi:hypothetical protein
VPMVQPAIHIIQSTSLVGPQEDQALRSITQIST